MSAVIAGQLPAPPAPRQDVCQSIKRPTAQQQHADETGPLGKNELHTRFEATDRVDVDNGFGKAFSARRLLRPWHPENKTSHNGREADHYQ